MADRLTQKEMAFKEEEIREWFRIFDKDDNGFINASELCRLMSQLGLKCTDDEIQGMMREADTNGDGQISYEEFKQMLKSRGDDDDDDIRKAFHIFDKDGNGFIDASELRQVMAHLGEEMTDEEIEGMMREADTDGDGQISYEEFKQIIKPCDDDEE